MVWWSNGSKELYFQYSLISISEILKIFDKVSKIIPPIVQIVLKNKLPKFVRMKEIQNEMTPKPKQLYTNCTWFLLLICIK